METIGLNPPAIDEDIRVAWSSRPFDEVDFEKLTMPSDLTCRKLHKQIDDFDSFIPLSIKLTRECDKSNILCIYLDPKALRYWLDVHNLLSPPFKMLQAYQNGAKWLWKVLRCRDPVYPSEYLNLKPDYPVLSINASGRSSQRVQSS